MLDKEKLARVASILGFTTTFGAEESGIDMDGSLVSWDKILETVNEVFGKCETKQQEASDLSIDPKAVVGIMDSLLDLEEKQAGLRGLELSCDSGCGEDYLKVSTCPADDFIRFSVFDSAYEDTTDNILLKEDKVEELYNFLGDFLNKQKPAKDDIETRVRKAEEALSNLEGEIKRVAHSCASNEEVIAGDKLHITSETFIDEDVANQIFILGSHNVSRETIKRMEFK